jgi:hypothetical protein
MNKNLFYSLSFIIIVFSLLDYNVIPFYSRLGLDFSNHHGFHHCKETPESIYKKKAVDCLDFEQRPYVYPPLMFTLFSWTKIFINFNDAYYAFLFLSFLAYALILMIWSNKKWLPILYGIGLFFTFPNLFLLERGNTDLFITLFWSLAYFFYQKNKFWAAGFFLALPVFSKLYPVFALFILSFYVLREIKLHRNLILGFVAFSFLFVVMDYQLWFEYLVDVLPKWSKSTTGVLNLAHSFKSIKTPLGSLFYLSAIFVWSLSAWKTAKHNVHWVFASGLALSTFNNGVSFDYNLVTVFPLLIIGFREINNRKGWLSPIALLIFGALCLGFRYPFVSFDQFPLVRLWMLAICLVLMPLQYFDLSFEVKRLKFIYLNKIRSIF